MNILLIDHDSKIPNLALMKLSAWYKLQGDNIGFNVSNPDRVYVSCVFTKNKPQVEGIKTFFDCEVIIGGSGYDLDSKLKDEIENIKPDYELYPNMEYSLGFTTRGCNRECYFCVVPKKEGKFRVNQHPKEFYDERFDKIMFLDNNVLLDKEWFFEVMKFVKEHNLSYSWNQGLDIRLLDMKVAKVLHKNKSFKTINFAWDNIELEQKIKNKIKILKNSGFNCRNNIQFFVYIDSDEEFESGLYRCNILKELGTNSFVMFNINKKRTKRIKRLQRWANRRWLFWSIDFEKYK